MTLQQDNVIEWLFDKIFDQIIGANTQVELYNTPFDEITKLTFDNDFVHKVINRLCKRPIDTIKEYLMNDQFQQKYLFKKLKKKLMCKLYLVIWIR